MTMKYRTKALLFSAALMGSTFVFAAPQIVESPGTVVNPDPVKVVKVPATNEQALSEMLFQFQQLQSEVASLRGRVEELQFELDQMRAESKDRYIDLDRRLAGQSGGNVVVVPDNSGIQNTIQDEPDLTDNQLTGNSGTSPEQIEAEYNQAKDLIREKDYAGAIQAFSDFVTRYPDSVYTANAWYWMGEVYLVIPDVERALASFRVVVDEHADHHKHPDALYRLGVTLLSKTDSEQEGRQLLEQLISEYPDSQLSQRARRTLDSL